MTSQSQGVSRLLFPFWLHHLPCSVLAAEQGRKRGCLTSPGRQSLLGHRERMGTPRDWWIHKKDPSFAGCFFSGACLSSQAQSLLFVPLIMPANATPILGTVSHVLSLVGGRNKTSCPLAPASLLHPWREKSHCPVCCHEAPPAVPQGRAPCPLYMRLHDGSAEAE